MAKRNVGTTLASATRSTGAVTGNGVEIAQGATKVAVLAKSPAGGETGTFTGAVQFSADGTNWFDSEGTTTYPASGSLSVGESTIGVYDVEGAYARLTGTVATSDLTFDAQIVSIGG